MNSECCEQKFKLDKAFHARNRAFVNKMTEFGGNGEVDYNAFEVEAKEHTSGKYDRVKVPDGVISWHSHPRKCLNSNACAIGLPSPIDLYNIYASVTKGTIWHIVYAAEGSYAIKVRQDYRDVLKERSDVLPALKERLMKDFVALHNRFKRSKARDYKNYSQQWFALAKRHGFVVQFYKGNTVPNLTIRYPCNRTTQVGKRRKAPPRSEWY
jgi:hypothetical protein